MVCFIVCNQLPEYRVTRDHHEGREGIRVVKMIPPLPIANGYFILI
jgi:hypothetical protein